MTSKIKSGHKNGQRKENVGRGGWQEVGLAKAGGGMMEKVGGEKSAESLKASCFSAAKCGKTFSSSLLPPSDSFLSVYLPLTQSLRLLTPPFFCLAFLSMASSLCVQPSVFCSFYSPRMHLVKACFTKTVFTHWNHCRWIWWQKSVS